MSDTIDYAGAAAITENTYILGLNATSPHPAKSKPGDLAHLIGDGTFIPVTEKGAANGVASLDSNAKVPASALADGYGDAKNPYGEKARSNVLIAPSGAAGPPAFRPLVADDIPSLPRAKVPDLFPMSPSDIPQLPREKISNLYPVGAIYLSVNHTSPASLFGGTWEMLPEGFALWTASAGAGGTIGAGLPNITGGFSNQSFVVSRDLNGTGAIRTSLSSYNRGVSSSGSQTYGQFSFDASRSSSIYGGSNTVQPPAIKVYAWKRVS